MDNGDPEVNDVAAEWDKDAFSVRATARHSRNCAECGTELKNLEMDLEASVPLNEIESFVALAAPQQKAFTKALSEGSATVECSDDGAESDESGGGRYAKNMITVRVNYCIAASATIDGKDVEIKHSGELVNESAASEYEECC